MMSPDPPRSDDFNNDSAPEGMPADAGNFHAIDDDEDIMGEGEHVLDYSSQPESWTSDDEEEDGVTAAHQMEDEVDEAGNVRVRTQYRMLIPFQIIDTEPDSNGDGIQEEEGPRNAHQDKPQFETTAAAESTSSKVERDTHIHILLKLKVQTKKFKLYAFYGL